MIGFWLRFSGLITLVSLALLLVASVLGQGMEKQVIAFVQDVAVNHAYGNIFYIEVNRGLIARLSHVEVGNCCLTWSPDGRQLAFARMPTRGHPSKIYVINWDGSNLRRLTTLDDSHQEFSPNWSPVGDQIIFTILQNDSFMYQFYEVNIENGNIKSIGNAAPAYSNPIYSPDGENILFGTQDGLYIMNSDGTNQIQLTSNSYYPAWSPDGAQIAYQVSNNISGHSDIWIMDADGRSKRQLTTNAINAGFPSWSPDATHITFSASQNGHFHLCIIDTDGSNQRQLTTHPVNHLFPAWQP
jgi:TolB protein